MEDLNNLQKIIGITLNNQALLRQAFTHRSYLNENSDPSLDNNERLEFLGDAVLELVVTEYLYAHYSNPEGELTNWRAALVCGTKLSEIARRLGFGDLLLLSKGEQQGSKRARQNILADCFEAVTGAIYLDQGFDVAKKFILENVIPELDGILKEKTFRDAKSKFQEAIQEKMGVTPEYKVLEETGPDHAKHFVVGAYVENELFGKGKGASKQEAQQEAASEGLNKILNLG